MNVIKPFIFLAKIFSLINEYTFFGKFIESNNIEFKFGLIILLKPLTTYYIIFIIIFITKKSLKNLFESLIYIKN